MFEFSQVMNVLGPVLSGLRLPPPNEKQVFQDTVFQAFLSCCIFEKTYSIFDLFTVKIGCYAGAVGKLYRTLHSVAGRR